ncbi:hypothetical protein Asppvi_011109 [Aspergillus pseudoviridinutans]|uniref:Uncharacterized protein n=1 Tax=Aspergillus pseudoviridinutans TaxID=1517512 RepID=A0A9P3BPI9_9EURO|nr:uncharacterized protein Asppvi_011109 [Aspergillus pseudoviridinutans]GIJ92133.1 hypothetical protein Asppvi_011109 [Aspergillus pseudoviridinutans]
MALAKPVVLCGKAPPVAIGVKEGLRPMYEEMGVKEIPSLLHGRRPDTTDLANLGCQRYGQKPVAIIVGGGYSDTDFTAMRRACDGISTVPWLRHDLKKDLSQGNPRPSLGPEYGKEIAEKVKRCLEDLAENGKLGSDGVYYF